MTTTMRPQEDAGTGEQVVHPELRLWNLLNIACWAYAIGDGRNRPTPTGAVVELTDTPDGVLARVVEVEVDAREQAVEMLRGVDGFGLSVNAANVRERIELQCTSVLRLHVVAPSPSWSIEDSIRQFDLVRVFDAREVASRFRVWVSVVESATRGTELGLGPENARGSADSIAGESGRSAP